MAWMRQRELDDLPNGLSIFVPLLIALTISYRVWGEEHGFVYGLGLFAAWKFYWYGVRNALSANEGTPPHRLDWLINTVAVLLWTGLYAFVMLILVLAAHGPF
ncbi:MAG: hypothetical protein M5U14_09375 [Acidimicrobiia bacterium]|nr:hypothetical protein [Acidimicrobiia bacterium]